MRIDNQARSASVRSRQAMIVVFLKSLPKVLSPFWRRVPPCLSAIFLRQQRDLKRVTVSIFAADVSVRPKREYARFGCSRDGFPDYLV
jgi:hypothetical protein